MPRYYDALYATLCETSPTLVELHLPLSYIKDPAYVLPCIAVARLVTITVISKMEITFIALWMIHAPSLRELDLRLIECELHQPQLPIYSSTGDIYPRLDQLCLRGYLVGGILAPFPTITQLVVEDANPPQLPTKLNTPFDSQQPEFSTLFPGLKSVMALPRFMQEIQDFIAARCEV